MHLRINEIWYLLHENADYFWGTHELLVTVTTSRRGSMCLGDGVGGRLFLVRPFAF